MDLVRSILLMAEDAGDELDGADVAALVYDLSTVGFHFELIEGHGLARARVQRSGSGRVLAANLGPLTWEGYDYLDSIRSDAVWRKPKQAIAKTVGDASLSVVKSVCTALATALIKESLGI